jgi:hypothetical protein
MNWFVDASQPPKAKKAPQFGTGSRTKHPRTLTEKRCASCNEVKPADQYRVDSSCYCCRVISCGSSCLLYGRQSGTLQPAQRPLELYGVS